MISLIRLLACLFLSCFAILPAQSCSNPPHESTPASTITEVDYEAIANELTDMSRVDQEVRMRLVAWMQENQGRNPPGELSEEMGGMDEEHAARVKDIIDQIGWPTNSKVGWEASNAAWLIIQHASHDLPLMQRALTLMEPYFQTGEISDQDYALLYDRVSVYQGRPQRYGTQGGMLVIDGIKHHGARPIEDVAHVDERRAAIGLGPLAEYLQLLRQMYGVPDDEPNLPLDMTMDEYNAIAAEMRAAQSEDDE
ncbi:MAG: hypothetical protein IID30_09695 [Planctomycetes bacterium]|nr:hypothetical protein [Planctomycetota bacterium]